MIILFYGKVGVVLQTLHCLLFTVYFLFCFYLLLLFAQSDNFLGSTLKVFKFR